jgi:hypothetical protein
MDTNIGGIREGNVGISVKSGPKNNFYVLLTNYSDEAYGVGWVALYEGEYTKETLPEYQPKGYGAELAESQRYFQRIDAYNSWTICGYGVVESSGLKSIRFCVNYPVQMRIENPSVTWSGSLQAYGLGMASNDIIELSVLQLLSGFATLRAICKDDVSATTQYMLYMSGGSNISLSADL